jgi:DNA-binding NarL/FixJ family response regulator
MLDCALASRAGCFSMVKSHPEGPVPGNGAAVRILVVEDHAPTGTAVAALLHATFEAIVVQVVRDAESALTSMAATPAHVVIMDIALPDMNGIEATRHLRELAPTVPVIIHSRSDSSVYRTKAAQAGARAFVSKRRTAQELVPAVRSVLGGRLDR